jgi:glycerophosphoryl diester phosphodiesterase
MNRRQAIKLISTAGATAFLPTPLIAKPSPFARGKEFLPSRKFVVGHRGACAYAPENTLASYRLAIAQGADYVEQDLQISSDGVLVCCHDAVLERVSNVAEVFPDRFLEKIVKGKKEKQWPIHKFTVKELKQLDFGSSFNPRFKGEKIPTWQEAIEEIKGKAGLCPETKAPEIYGKLGFDMEALFVDALKKNSLDKPTKNSSTPVLVQSFSRASLEKLVAKHDLQLPLLWLTGANSPWTSKIFDEAGKLVAVLGPHKGDVTASFVEQAHSRGMKIVSFTFRSAEVGKFPTVKDEMRHFLYDLGVDGMFTDNPDQFPRQK